MLQFQSFSPAYLGAMAGLMGEQDQGTATFDI